MQRCEQSGILSTGAEVQVLQSSILQTDVLQDLPRTLTHRKHENVPCLLLPLWKSVHRREPHSGMRLTSLQMHYPVENVTTGQPQLTGFQYYFNFCEVGFIHPKCWTQYKEGMPNWKDPHNTYRIAYCGTFVFFWLNPIVCLPPWTIKIIFIMDLAMTLNPFVFKTV